MCITWNTTLVINDYKIEEYLRLVWEAPGSVNLEYRFEMILFHLDMKFGIMRASLKQIGNIPYSSNSMKVKILATEEIYPTRGMIQNQATAKP